MTEKLPDNRRKYRIWQDNELRLEIKAKQMGMSKSRALNVLLAQALAGIYVEPVKSEPDELETLTDLDRFDSF